ENAGYRAQRRVQSSGMHVQQVWNDLRMPRVRKRCAGDAGRAMVHSRHRVEQMRETAGAALERCHAVFVSAERMANLDAETGGAQRRNDVEIAGQLRR